jgi:hypothetical protein
MILVAASLLNLENRVENLTVDKALGSKEYKRRSWGTKHL